MGALSRTDNEENSKKAASSRKEAQRGDLDRVSDDFHPVDNRSLPDEPISDIPGIEA